MWNFKLLAGIVNDSWRANDALRMRVSMSEMGSVIMASPACLDKPRDFASKTKLSEANSAKAEVTVITARTTANATAVVQAHFRVFAFSGFYLALVLLVNHGCFSHVVLSSPWTSFRLSWLLTTEKLTF